VRFIALNSIIVIKPILIETKSTILYISLKEGNVSGFIINHHDEL